MKTIAIDPGERVGWAVGELTEDGCDVTARGVSPLRDFALKLGEVYPDYDEIVVETWRLYPAAAKVMIGNDMQPSQLIGMIRYFGWIHGNPPVFQGANIKETALRTMPDDLKESLSLSSEQHDQDAVMHLWHRWWTKYVANKEAK